MLLDFVDLVRIVEPEVRGWRGMFKIPVVYRRHKHPA
jgi:hypothetical protein